MTQYSEESITTHQDSSLRFSLRLQCKYFVCVSLQLHAIQYLLSLTSFNKAFLHNHVHNFKHMSSSSEVNVIAQMLNFGMCLSTLPWVTNTIIKYVTRLHSTLLWGVEELSFSHHDMP